MTNVIGTPKAQSRIGMSQLLWFPTCHVNVETHVWFQRSYAPAAKATGLSSTGQKAAMQPANAPPSCSSDAQALFFTGALFLTGALSRQS